MEKSKGAAGRDFFSLLAKDFNPYHDAKGRFTTANGASFFTFSPGKSAAHNKAIEKEKSRVPAMTMEEYLSAQGVGGAFSDFMLDKLRMPHGLTARQEKQFHKEADAAREKYFAKREKAIAEYKEKVKKGELREKTTVEKLIETARGHSDNERVQAARRALKKRGISWEEGVSGLPPRL